MTQFVQFKEICDWEGETWRFWLQLDGNEKALKDLKHLLDANEEYQLDLDVMLEEAEVDFLVKYTIDGYLAYENKVTGTLVLPQWLFDEAEPKNEYEYPFEGLGKGKIVSLFQ